jgi:dolichyl-phosphate-mannose--protein O-mannosyl transferase
VRLRLPESGPRRHLVLALGLFLLAAVFRFPGLSYPAEEYFDEVYHAKSARQYLAGESPEDWVHPPTAKLLIAVGVWAFGYESGAWRLAPALAGSLLAPVFFLLARRALATERAALLATLLLLADGVYLVQSRVAMTNIFAVLFQLAAAACVLRAGLRERLHPGWMVLLGLSLGLALSSRWTSLWATAFLALVLLCLRGRRLFEPRELGLVLLAFVVIPGVVYATSYLPLLVHGHLRVAEPSPNPLRSVADVSRGVRQLVEEQVQIWRYHANLDATHPYYSPWWSWPWLYRPTWYFYWQDPSASRSTVRGILALGNPALWWLCVPATLWSLVTGLRARDPRRLFAAAGFLCLYLPWAVAPRRLNFGHYLFEAIPYACLSLGIILDRTWETRYRVLAQGYLALVGILFLYFLPFLTAMPIPSSWFFHELFEGGPKPWSWFRSWI